MFSNISYKLINVFSPTLLLLLLLTHLIIAAPGDLDTTFNSTGIATTTVTSVNDVANGVAYQPDGKIVVAGFGNDGTEFLLVRYTSSGALDTTFGTGGIVRTSFPSGAAISAIALQADSKILVGGYIVSSSQRQFAVARYLISGALDPTFGSAGIFTTPINLLSGDEIFALTTQADGKIVATGSIDAGAQMGTIRLTSSGNLDSLSMPEESF